MYWLNKTKYEGKIPEITFCPRSQQGGDGCSHILFSSINDIAASGA